MPHPATVWAVDLTFEGPLREVKGSLSLEADALVFTPRNEVEPPRRFPLSTLAKVRRLIGSPVLLVVRREVGREARTAFYFVRPPPLERREEAPRPGFLGFQRSTERKTRRQNLGYFGVWNREKKSLIREWERAVRTALRSARG